MVTTDVIWRFIVYSERADGLARICILFVFFRSDRPSRAMEIKH